MTEETLVQVPQGTDLHKEATKNFWSNIKYHSLFCLIEVNGHLAISELARRVGLTIDETVHALESMELIGKIKKTSDGYVQIESHATRIPTNRTHKEIMSQFVLSQMQVSSRILETLENENQITRCITYNSNQALVKELYSKINKAIEEFKEKSDNSKQSWDGVYNLSTSLIQMTSGAK